LIVTTLSRNQTEDTGREPEWANSSFLRMTSGIALGADSQVAGGSSTRSNFASPNK